MATFAYGKQLSDKNPTGTGLGQSPTDKIGFFGQSAVTQGTLPASIGTTATTAIQKAAINKLRTILKNNGLGV